MELLTLLSKPSREFTPIPFWFLNGNLTHGWPARSGQSGNHAGE